MNTPIDTPDSQALDGLSSSSPSTPWIPRPWSDELHGLKFLPRMLQKARRLLESKRTGRDLMAGFLFGDVEYADKQIFAFLHTNQTRVLQLVAAHSDDETVARILLDEGNCTSEQIQDWNRRFLRRNALFIPMWDADEGRRAPGLGTSLLSFFYNCIMMPPVYSLFRIQNASNQRRLQAQLQMKSAQV